jgi:hypothetical protein
MFWKFPTATAQLKMNYTSANAGLMPHMNYDSEDHKYPQHFLDARRSLLCFRLAATIREGGNTVPISRNESGTSILLVEKRSDSIAHQTCQR